MSAGILLGLAGIVLSFFAPDQYKKWFLLSGIATLLLAMGGKTYLHGLMERGLAVQNESGYVEKSAKGAY